MKALVFLLLILVPVMAFQNCAQLPDEKDEVASQSWNKTRAFAEIDEIESSELPTTSKPGEQFILKLKFDHAARTLVRSVYREGDAQPICEAPAGNYEALSAAFGKVYLDDRPGIVRAQWIRELAKLRFADGRLDQVMVGSTGISGFQDFQEQLLALANCSRQ